MDSLPQLPDSFALGVLVGLVLPWVLARGFKLALYGFLILVAFVLVSASGAL